MLDALEMESRILWNFRFVVLNAVPVGMLGGEGGKEKNVCWESKNEFEFCEPCLVLHINTSSAARSLNALKSRDI